MAWHHRVAALIGALLFLTTSLGLSFLVIWQMHQQSRQDSINKGLQEALAKAKTQQQTPTTTPKEGKLEGTQLTGFTPVAKIDTLGKVDTVPGTGAEVKSGDTVT